MPDEEVYAWQPILVNWYPIFGFLDRSFELILAADLETHPWNDAEILVQLGTINRRLGFTAHPKYLEVAEALDFTGLWEQRGPPDFCEKVGDEWVCE